MKPDNFAYLLVIFVLSFISVVSGQQPSTNTSTTNSTTNTSANNTTNTSANNSTNTSTNNSTNTSTNNSTNISTQCVQVINSVANVTCIQSTQFGTVLFNPNSTAPQIVQAIGTLCSGTPCDTKTISQVLSNVTNACQSEIKANNTEVIKLDALLTYYQPLMSSICSKNSSGTYCGIQSYPVFLGLLDISADITGLIASSPNSSVCTTCTQTIATSFFNYTPSSPPIPVLQAHDLAIAQALQAKCGSSLSVTTGSNTTNSTGSKNTDSTKSSSSVSMYSSGADYVLWVVLFILSAAVL